MSLDHDTAIRRALLIRNASIQYNFHIILEPTRYHGLAQLTFYLETAKLQQDLQIDFSGKQVETIIVNNLQVQISRSDNFLFIPKAYLQKGRNRVSILYQCVYDIDQVGCISFDDEGEQLVYTDFQPYAANRTFPCFDQPDLKATFQLTVLASQDWRVLSNQNPNSVAKYQQQTYLQQANWGNQKSRYLLNNFSKKVGNNTKITTFPSSKLLPSYIFCFAAGNYKEIPTKAGTVSMSLFCPPSSLSNLQFYSSFIFDVTIKCMDFYERTFGIKYPFPKYDQIFVRQCGFSAMQNAGLVTFNEPRFLRNRNPTQSDYYRFALVIAHELSHHWFGNYVTMKWWDDVWLNESFAEWISCYCLQKLKTTFDYPFQSAYFYFRDNKVYGYEEDERNGATHPIRGVVNNTLEAQSIFDGITYNKGASVLKQLMFLVTQAKFSASLFSYFGRFPYGNADIDDLLEDLTPAFPITVDVKSWKDSWLLQSSLNVFSIDWDQTNSLINITQSSFNNNNILRTHQIKVALFKSDGTFDVIDPPTLINPKLNPTPVSYSTYIGPYSAVLVNHDDETFVQNIIDPISLDFFKNNIDKITDLFTRINIWYNIRSMVNLSLIPIADYVDLIENKLFTQKSYVILGKILNNLSNYLDEFVNQSVGDSLRSKVFQIIYRELINAPDDKSRILILQNSFISYARQDDEIAYLQNWLFGKDILLQKRILNNDQKWSIVKKIYTLKNMTTAAKSAIFAQIKTQDTDTARISDADTICKVIIADKVQFEAIYEQFKSTTVGLTQKILKLNGWRNIFHYDWIVEYYQERYYQDIVLVSQTLSYDEFQFFYDRLQPVDSNSTYHIDKYNQVIVQLEKLDGMEQHCRNLRKIIDDLSLRVKNVAYNSDINNALSQVRANLRFAYIKPGSISYNYHIGFVKTENYYTGMAEISFELTQVPIFLPLDCICETIYSLYVNGKKIAYPNTNAQFLFIHEEYLIQGSNFISIHYRNKYNNDGLGCMSYIQTVTTPNPQYIYTKFEPYGAHRFAPCFDQPDLKAKVTYNVIVPTGWMAAANQRSYHNGVYSFAEYQQFARITDNNLIIDYLQNKQGNFYTFFPTQILSTYLYCVVAGEYYSVQATAAQLYKNIPMTVYSIKSYSAYLDRLAPFIFEMTTLSLQLYETYFGAKYPFSKYQSVFCHEFKSGAMQNAGIITFNDTYLYPQQVSLQKMLAFASTIVHQNSHNWFGNYVTMKWWDDLWLNESFADFIAHWCLQKIKDKVTTIPKYDSGWKLFLVRGVLGYREDQITETTHAVRSIVENTSVASTYFDRITYQKGSATLKQFVFLMGEDNFFKGVKDYFQQFRWSNGTIDDFLGKMKPYFNDSVFTLDEWKQSWLITPSLNVVSVQWDPSDLSANAKLTINQRAYTDKYPTLRYHKTRVAFFKMDNTYVVQDILLTPTPTTTLIYDGSQNYQAVLVNVDYWSYFKYEIDTTSLNYFIANLNSIAEVLTRMIIWHDMNERVRDSGYQVAAFKDLFLKYIFTETDDKIFQFQCSFIRDALNNYIPIQIRPTIKSQVFLATYNALVNAPVKDDKLNRIKLLKDQLTVFASTYDQVQLLDGWRNGSNADLAPYPKTNSQAWQVVKLVYSQDDPRITAQAKKQALLDQTFINPGIKAQLTANTCNIIIADAVLMSTTYDSFKQMDLSLDAKASYAEGWNNFLHLDELTTIYKPRYFADLVGLSKTLISNHFEFFYQNLKPIDDNLQDTIDGYSGINLEGSNLIGHKKVLTQIKYNYGLRQGLYAYNAG